MSGDLLITALRRATRKAHDTLERDAGVEAALRSFADRPAMVEAFLRLHRAVEGALRPWLQQVREAGFPAEPRSPMIFEDLRALGRSGVPDDAEPVIGSLGEAFGWLYVAEGSMLGGRVMRKAMRRDGIALTGLAFLDPHGEDTGPRWQGFLRTLESVGSSGQVREADVARGGRDAFDLAQRLLVPRRRLESAA